MKRAMALSFALLWMLALSACGAPGESGGQSPAPSVVSPAADDWGLILTAEGASPTGLTLRFTQSGGAPSGQLQTGSPYWLERQDGENWQAVPALISEDELAWDMMAYLIAADGVTELELDWTWLYGPLPGGRYRVGKEVMDFRDTGDYDTSIYYAAFEL